MCPFCIGAAAWAAAGVVSTAGGLGVLAAVVQRRAAGDAKNQAVNPATDGREADSGRSLASGPTS
jgi:hypothetical protein